MVRKDKRAKRLLADPRELPVPLEDLAARGQDYFDREDYTSAIRAWERLWNEQPLARLDEKRLAAALAEAYFRRGATSLPPSMADLVRAAELTPTEPRYRYRLGEVYYRRGDWESAVEWFGPLVEGAKPYARAAVPLAAALISLRVDITKHRVWHLVPAEDRAWLVRVWALVNPQGRRAPVPSDAETAGAGSFWNNVSGVVSGRSGAAVALEEQISNESLPPLCAAVGHYYLGVLAWREGSLHRAAVAWKTSIQLGLHTSWARHNMFAVCQHLAVELIDGIWDEGEVSASDGLLEPAARDRLEQALQWADLGLQIVPDDALLLEVKRHIVFHLGYAAAISGNWEIAAKCWQDGKDAGDGSRSLLINLAIASEKLGRYALAADCWAQVVRRRPKSPNSPSVWGQEQVARMWRHVAENYRKAGDYEAATRTYRNAVKWAPADSSLKLDLVEALMADGRSRAASTVVEEILHVDGDNVEALCWQATIREEDRFYGEAERLWRRVLTLQPDHLRSRMRIAGLYEADGDVLRQSGKLASALTSYHQGLQYMPENPRLHTSIALCHAQQQDMEAARQHFRLALENASNLTDAYYWVIRGWLYLGDWDEVHSSILQTEKLRPPPSGRFYVDMAEYAAHLGRSEWIDYFLERAYSQEPDNTQLLVDIALVLGENGESKKAVDYLLRVAQMDPQSAVAHMWLGNYYFSFLQEPELAEQHWTRAEELAREAKNLGVLFQMRMIKGIRRVHNVAGSSDGIQHLPESSRGPQGE